ncbi:MAG TPA: hypothetical protein VF984_14695 [Actinomycetota bacterium]
MSANLQVAGGHLRPRASLATVMALILSVTALEGVTTLIVQRANESVAPAPAVVAPNPWAGADAYRLGGGATVRSRLREARFEAGTIEGPRLAHRLDVATRRGTGSSQERRLPHGFEAEHSR